MPNHLFVPKIQLDKTKASWTLRQRINHVLQFKRDVLDNKIITDSFTVKKEVSLNFSGTIQLAKNLVNNINTNF